MSEDRVAAEDTVEAVVRRHPGLRPVLMAYGLCACCSGELTLRRAASDRGLPLADLLQDLERGLENGP